MSISKAINLSQAVEAVRPAYVWELKDIFNFFEDIDSILALPVEAHMGDRISDRISELLIQYPSSTQVCASAKWYKAAVYKCEYDRIAQMIKSKDIPEELKGLTSPSILKNYIESRIADFIHIETKADRTNSAITHTLDALRSLLSSAKVERQISSYAQNV